jgi:N6-L-threonylcarbamoyladenine synthase
MTSDRPTTLAESAGPASAAPRDRPLVVLGIETSCDETAAAIVRRNADGSGEIMSNIVRSQLAEHGPYGGVVPEIAARAHVQCLGPIAREALASAGVALAEVDLIAATAGPGLIGGLLAGLTFAKALALSSAKPFIAINHLEAHALTVGLTDRLAPPYLMLLVSGGHTQTVLVEAVGRYRRIGSTIDDALGEAFDKTAKILGLGYPGGPAVERAAHAGDPARFDLPRPLMGRPEPNFSFAGLKTAVRRTVQRLAEDGGVSERSIADLCASFEAAVAETVVDRCRRAFEVAERRPSGRMLLLVVSGGVAANTRLRAALTAFAEAHGTRAIFPPIGLCTDNGAMIAWAGAERFIAGDSDDLAFEARARWPLDAAASPLLGAGKHGAKA